MGTALIFNLDFSILFKCSRMIYDSNNEKEDSKEVTLKIASIVPT